MKPVTLINRLQLHTLSQAAAAHPRRRLNHNFHPDNTYPAHRLLNAIQPGSYVAPHRHLDPHKDETMLVVAGRLGVVFFDDDGEISQLTVAEAGGDVIGVDIPHGCWHTVLALTPDTVFFEAKAGPYLPLTDAEKAPWAPQEGSADVAAYLAQLHTRLAEACPEGAST